jgi:hypothetical protein
MLLWQFVVLSASSCVCYTASIVWLLQQGHPIQLLYVECPYTIYCAEETRVTYISVYGLLLRRMDFISKSWKETLNFYERQ